MPILNPSKSLKLSGRRALAFALVALPCLGAGAQEISDPVMPEDMTGAEVRIVQDVPDILAGGLTVTPAEGEPFTAMFKPDGTFETDTGKAGGWTMQQGYLCLSDTEGALMCSVVAEVAQPGDSWTVTNPAGELTTYALPATP